MSCVYVCVCFVIPFFQSVSRRHDVASILSRDIKERKKKKRKSKKKWLSHFLIHACSRSLLHTFAFFIRKHTNTDILSSIIIPLFPQEIKTEEFPPHSFLCSSTLSCIPLTSRDSVIYVCISIYLLYIYICIYIYKVSTCTILCIVFAKSLDHAFSRVLSHRPPLAGTSGNPLYFSALYQPLLSWFLFFFSFLC